MEHLTKLWGEQVDQPPSHLRGILQTKDYEHFMILSDTGNLLYEWEGAKKANKCLPGDHVAWVNEQCELELRDEHPLIVGTLELTSKSTYGMTKRGHMMYLCTPYDKRYPAFVVGSSEKDRSKNKIVLIKLEDWKGTFPRGSIQQTLGNSGDEKAERDALIWQACPWRYPEYDYQPKLVDAPQTKRVELVGHTFHIDPQGCKDVDDVITIKEEVDSWTVTITISDVASYVEDGGAIDILASLIGQTLYDTTGKVVRPMLPTEYSEKACSLLPGKESYGVSLQFTWTGNEMINLKWFQSKFVVSQSFTYEEFQETNSPMREVVKEIASYLANERLDDAHDWVAQMMILYNTEAGKCLKHIKTGVLRRHSEPDRERLARYKEYVPELEKLAFSSAEYCLAEENDTTHYGLNTTTYAHASSPIRRYADLINQRILIRLIQQNNEMYIVPLAMYDMNMREKAIRRYARDSDYLSAIMSGKNTFTGIIIDKTMNGDWVTIRLYVPEWKRIIATTYRCLSENIAISRDETKEIDITLYQQITFQCVFSPNARNWKDRVLIQLS